MFVANSNRQKEIKMKNKLFDDFVQKQFDGYKPEVGAHIWENIARKKEKQKPVGFWFSNFGKIAAVAVVILSCIGVGYYFMRNSNMPTKEIAVNKEKQTLPTLNMDTEILPVGEQVQPNKKAISASSNSTYLSNKKSNTLKNITQENSNNTSSSLLKSTNENKGINVTNKGTENKFLNGNSEVNISKMKKEEIVNIALAANIATMDVIKQNLLFIPTVYVKKLPFKAFIPCPEAEENGAGNKRYLEVYGGPDYIFKTYTDTGVAYIAQRKASTGIHYAFSAGARYTKVFGSGISFRTGLNYSQINERFIAFNGFILERFVQVNSIGDTIANYTTATVQYKKSNNIYRSIDIPIQAGFEFGNGRLHTNLSAGALINIRSRQTGNALEPNGNVINLSDAKANSKYQYKSNVGISFLGSVSFYYKLNEKLHLMAEPYLRYSLSPMTKSEITFSQKFHTAGLRLGLRKDL
jgi:hypothetical protein